MSLTAGIHGDSLKELSENLSEMANKLKTLAIEPQLFAEAFLEHLDDYQYDATVIYKNLKLHMEGGAASLVQSLLAAAIESGDLSLTHADKPCEVGGLDGLDLVFTRDITLSKKD